MPLVSAVIPTYNQSCLVKETALSALAQTLGDLEVIVVDDGSTDDTRTVIAGIHDARVRYFYKSNGGTSSARNYGLLKAVGDYIAFLDHDDLWPPNFLEVMVARLQKDNDYGLVYSPITVVYHDGRMIKSYKKPEGKSGWLTKELWKHGLIWPSAAVIRRSVLENFGFDESLRQSYEDGDFFLRLSVRTQFLFVDEVEAIKREHENNLSRSVGVQPTRILVLERFYFQLGGDKVIPAMIARRKLRHACRKVAEEKRRGKARKAALSLYRRAISYWPYDLRLYAGLLLTLLIKVSSDTEPDWQIPEPLSRQI